MDNAALDEKYQKKRKAIEEAFEKYPPLVDKAVEHTSPSGNFRLTVTPHETGEGYWNYTRGTVVDLKTGETLFEVLRNYGSFGFQWIEHQNGNEYLICGEDYQGYVTLNLTEKKKHVFFPEEGFEGFGFCWVEIKEYDKDIDDTLRVEGCYWGAPFEVVEYKFDDPDTVPYEEIGREPVEYEDDWDDDDEEDEED